MVKETPILASLHNTVRYENGTVILLNRRLLPLKVEHVACSDFEHVARAIEEMTVQGAVVIAMVAGYGVALALEHCGFRDKGAIEKFIVRVLKRFRKTRSTGQRLNVVLDKCEIELEQSLAAGVTLPEELAERVRKLVDLEVETADQIAKNCGYRTAELLEDGDKILTHCFADSALIHMAIAAKEAGKEIEMFCTETRPYLQGARLTAPSIRDTGTKVTIVTDNMPGFLIQQGMITKFITAADKITLDGYVCNKIGTYQYAVVAKQHGIPFYVLGYEGPDENSKTVESIEVEYRNPEEVFYFDSKRVTVDGIRGLYPAFDIVPPHFVTRIVTDRGVFPAERIYEHLSRKPV